MLSADLASSSYLRPLRLGDALSALAERPLRIVAGATDLFPSHVARPLPGAILDITAIDGLKGIAHDGNSWRIGAATSWSEIRDARLPSAFAGLQEAARQVGSIQVQNRGTIAGNLCNASPAADGVPPLLALDASVEISRREGSRLVPLSEFIAGYRRTILGPAEMVTAIIVPEPDPSARSVFLKLGARSFLVISIVMVAATIVRDAAGAIRSAAVAVGSASEKAMRLTELERSLAGLAADIRPSSVLRIEHLSPLSPIDDIRASGDYRRDAAFRLVADALDMAAEFVP